MGNVTRTPSGNIEIDQTDEAKDEFHQGQYVLCEILRELKRITFNLREILDKDPGEQSEHIDEEIDE